MANIKVFARLRPCENINQELFKREDHVLYISSHGQVETDAGTSSAAAEDSKWIKFRFAHVFDMDSSQKNVFEVSAKDIVEAFLEGYNGAIFAYGQTGAGKTYTMQGIGEEGCLQGRSEHFGIIPQSLSLIFEKLEQNQDEAVNLHISFLEIYKETAYDLLGPPLFKGPQKIKDLPKVLVTTGGNGSCRLHGLSYHLVASEKEAMKLCNLGVANRKTAETTVNQRSSRSHTIFTIALSRQRHGAEILFRSKLYLVDLAGSEQICKSSAMEHQISGAKFVNMSLHHLETVIIALQKFNVKNMRNHKRKKQTVKQIKRSSSAILCRARSADGVHLPRTYARLKSASAVELGNGKGRHSPVVMKYEPVHVPYRNSLLTMVLQDSLGGNCNAAMIAVLSLEKKSLYETISTCRFAQRVARVVNKPIQNEEIDKDMVIKRLQTTLAKLYLELANYKAAEQEKVMLHREDGINHESEQDYVNVMHSFLTGRINDPVAHGVNTPRKFRATLRYLRQILVGSSPHSPLSGHEESGDERDSGVRTGSELTSPLASEWENDHVHFNASNFTAQLPSHVSTFAGGLQHRSSITQESVVSLNTDLEEPIPDSDWPGHSALQLSGRGTSEVSTQTTLLATSEEKQSKRDVCPEKEKMQPLANSHGDVRIWELQLQKETLLNRSKMFASRLADQRARVVVMMRQGAVPEDLENEKIVELQLQKKQREVENKLSLVIKKLADVKYTERKQKPQKKELCFEEQAAEGGDERLPTCTAQTSQMKDRHRVVTQTFKELELKEEFTRQKLLARREQMRNFGFSPQTTPHEISCQSPVSVSSFPSETGRASLSVTSSMTLLCEGDRQICPTPPVNNRNFVVKPPRIKSRMSDNSLQMNRTAPSSRSTLLRRAFSNQERLSRKDKCVTLRRDADAKRCPLVEYINNSRQAIYVKSTFRRRIGSGVRGDAGNVKKVPIKVPKIQGATVTDDKTNLLGSTASGCCDSSAKAEYVLKNATDKVHEKVELNTRHVTEIQAELSHENKSTGYENVHLSFPEAMAGKSREEILDQKTPSLVCLKREQRERVKKIRECVHAAEAIQRTWRLYKRHQDSENGR